MSPRPSARLRGAIFDIGNVLIRLRPLEAALPAQSVLAGGVLAAGALADPLSRLRADPVLDLLERGRATDRDFFEAVRRAVGARLGDDEIRAAYLSILGDPMPGMVELLRELLDRGLHLVGLSDISPGHLEAIARYPAVGLLGQVIASCRTGHRKPERGAFEAALSALGTRPDETLFIDDRPENVAGAAAMGLHAIPFTGAPELRAELEVLLGPAGGV